MHHDSRGHAILTCQLLEFYFYSRPYCFPCARCKHNKPFLRKYHMLDTQSNVNRKFLHSLLMKTPLLENYGLYTSFYTLLSLRSIFPNNCQHQVIDYYTLTVLLWPLGVTITKITDCQQVLPKHWNTFTKTTWYHNPLHCNLYIHRR